jgi:hypothetical protein
MPLRRGGGGGESKQGLVITLVFFVIATIGLGVATYFGFAGQDALASKEKETAGNYKKMEGNRDYYKAQALAYRAVLGQKGTLDAGEVYDLKSRLDEGKLGTGEKDSVEVQSLLGPQGIFAQRGVTWDPATKLPRKSYEDLLSDARGQIENLERQNKEFQRARDDAAATASKADVAAKKARDDFEARAAEMQKKQEADLSGYLKQIADLRSEIDRMGAERGDVVKKAEGQVKTAQEALAKQNTTAQQLRKQIEVREAELERRRQEGADAPLNAPTDWKVVSVGGGGTVYINLGSADNVKPQLTFSVHASGPSGRIVPASKGSVEVESVLEPHLSRGRVIAAKDPGRDPIVRGDVLYNPTWDPQSKRHVALAGIMDMTGSGHDSFDELKRYLERNNVIIDAYLDPKDLTIKGKGITPSTDYLILGTGQEIAQENRASREKDRVERRDRAIQELMNQAQQSGVKTLSLRHYLDLIGYRVPRTDSELGSAARPSYRPELPPPAAAAPQAGGAEGKEPKGEEKDKEKPPAGDKP